MLLLFDFLLLLLLLLIVICDVRKGFLRSFIGFSRILIALALAFALSGFLATAIHEQWMLPSVHESIQNAIENTAFDDDSVVSSVPVGFRAIASIGGIDLREIVGNASDSDLAFTLAQPISQCISATIAFVVVLIAAYFALKLLVPFLSKIIRSISFLKAADTVGGLLFGIFHAFLIGCALSFFFAFLLSLFGMSLDETYVIRFFNHVSPVKAIVWIFLR